MLINNREVMRLVACLSTLPGAEIRTGDDWLRVSVPLANGTEELFVALEQASLKASFFITWGSHDHYDEWALSDKGEWEYVGTEAPYPIPC